MFVLLLNRQYQQCHLCQHPDEHTLLSPFMVGSRRAYLRICMPSDARHCVGLCQQRALYEYHDHLREWHFSIRIGRKFFEGITFQERQNDACKVDKFYRRLSRLPTWMSRSGDSSNVRFVYGVC